MNLHDPMTTYFSINIILVKFVLRILEFLTSYQLGLIKDFEVVQNKFYKIASKNCNINKELHTP